jgi:ubiquinone/menaquinone biosynthesis C-methylase UbiE
MGSLHDRQVNAHYAREDLADVIDGALRASSADAAQPLAADLAPIDQFHHRAVEATRELAMLAEIGPHTHVLDVGGGLGGPARLLAQATGCRVTVLDVTEMYCRVGEELTRRAGLGARVSFRVGSASEIPARDESADVVWTQHSTMTIADKPRLYAEVRRVLRAGGKLAMHEVVAGTVQPIHFPVPWAAEESISHLVSADVLRATIVDAGLRERAWLDVSEPSLAWFRERRESPPAGGPRLGLKLLMGDIFRPAAENQMRNLAEGRTAVIQAVFEKPFA